MLRFLNIVLVACLLGYGIWSFYSDELTPADRKILFVGNSFTFVGDVPGQVRALAAAADNPVTYHTRMIAKPAYRLSQHVKERTILRELATGTWDVVVIQGYSGATFFPEADRMMKINAKRIAEAARTAGTQVILFAHWSPGPTPATRQLGFIDRIDRNYRDLGRQIDTTVAPVGKTWARARGRGIKGLYHPDLHHASPLGAYAAAVTILAALGDVSPVETDWYPGGIPAEAAQTLRAIANGSSGFPTILPQ